MIFNNIAIENLDKFFDLVDSCEGKIELVSEDMRINLKSRLAQYFSLTKLASASAEGIPEIEIVAESDNDKSKLIQFMMNGNK